MTARFGCVVLTQGHRPDELKEAVESLLRQRDVDVDVAVVVNGCAGASVPPGVRVRELPDNVGIPAGRNAGAGDVEGDLLVFLDDDASLPAEDTLARVAAVFRAEQGLGLLQLHPVDPDGRRTPRRWVPRLRVGDESRSSDVCALWEGAVVLPREVFDRVGGWPGSFFYAHEGIDLAWRVWDAGLRVRYAGDILAHHGVGPCVTERHPYRHRLRARNRVWLARRNLPVPLGAAYLVTWTALTVVRLRSWQELSDAAHGCREGFRTPCGERHPIAWRTAWRMARAGRPPVV